MIAVHGWAITRAVQLVQKRLAPGVSQRRLRLAAAVEAALEEALDPADDPARQDPVAEHRDQRRQQRRRGQDRDGDDGHRPQRHRAQRLVVDHPEAGEGDDHGEAGEGDGEARGRERLGARLALGEAGFALLAVAGEDEQRVVDRDPDPDHRGHVGDEDRLVHLQRDEVDEGAGDEDADEAERQRQRRGGERAEDDEQDDRDDREAARLGLREVLLRDLLHPGPDRRLSDQVGGDAAPRRCRGRGRFAQVAGGVDQLVGGTGRCAAAAALPVRCNSTRRAAARRRQRHALRPSATSRRTRSTAAARSAALAPSSASSRTAIPSALGRSRPAALARPPSTRCRERRSRRRSGARSAGGERQREDDDQDPGPDDPAAAPAEDPASPSFVAHQLVSGLPHAAGAGL